jgi:ribonuclease BN (tRNA processing enzyme)
VDVLIHDTTYFDDEYPSKVNWGHSSIGQVVRLAHAADVDRLYLFHHDPEHADQDIDRKLQVARALVTELGSRVDCVLAIEGETYELGVSRLASQRLG